MPLCGKLKTWKQTGGTSGSVIHTNEHESLCSGGRVGRETPITNDKYFSGTLEHRKSELGLAVFVFRLSLTITLHFPLFQREPIRLPFDQTTLPPQWNILPHFKLSKCRECRAFRCGRSPPFSRLLF